MAAPSGGSEEPRSGSATSASSERDHKADPDRHQRQLDVLDERGLEGVSPVLAHPARAEPVVVPQAVGPTAEVRDDRAAGLAEAGHFSRSSRFTTPSGDPSAPTTRSASRRSAMRSGERVPQARVRGQARQSVLRRRRELELAERLQRERLERPVAADEVRHELVHRVLEDLLRRVVLGEPAALAEDRDPVADLDRLVDVVRDEDDGLAQLLLKPEELVLQPRAHDRVDRAERLVHQHQGRIGGERSCEPDALALTAGELRGEALRVRRVEPDKVEQLGGALLDPRARSAEQLGHRADVRLHRHVREEADLLDDVADRAAELGEVVVADLTCRRCGCSRS